MNAHEWLQTFVRIPSVNPALNDSDESVAGEARMAAALEAAFRQVGASRVEREEVEPGRPNVYAFFKGRSDKNVGWEIHSDTVGGIKRMTVDPFGGTIANGRVYGRGAVDNKASYGVALSLLEKANKLGQLPEHNLVIFATVGEESGHLGAAKLNAWGKKHGLFFEMILVAEPTECKPVYAHTGVVRMAFVVRGKPAHTSRPQDGVNALVEAIPIKLALLEEEQRLLNGQPGVTGLPQLTIVKGVGGVGGNTVPSDYYIEIDRRLVPGLPGEDPELVIAQLTEIARGACKLPVSVAWKRGAPAVYTDPGTPAVQLFARLSGNAPATAPYGTDADQLGPDLVRDFLVFGPGTIRDAHTEDESVAISELERAEAICGAWLNFR